MQEAQAFCNVGGTSPPEALPSPTYIHLPRRPSFSLELYERFSHDIIDPAASSISLDKDSSLNMDVEMDDATSGIPPSVSDTAIVSSDSLFLDLSSASSSGPVLGC